MDTGTEENLVDRLTQSLLQAGSGGGDMGEDTKHVSLRLPVRVVEALDDYAESLSKLTGIRVSRTDATRLLVERGLELASGVVDKGMTPDGPTLARLVQKALDAPP